MSSKVRKRDEPAKAKISGGIYDDPVTGHGRYACQTAEGVKFSFDMEEYQRLSEDGFVPEELAGVELPGFMMTNATQQARPRIIGCPTDGELLVEPDSTALRPQKDGPSDGTTNGST